MLPITEKIDELTDSAPGVYKLIDTYCNDLVDMLDAREVVGPNNSLKRHGNIRKFFSSKIVELEAIQKRQELREGRICAAELLSEYLCVHTERQNVANLAEPNGPAML